MRFNDWEKRLGVYLAGRRTMPFAWGVHDCCMFTAGAVEAMTGVDHMSEFRGRYRSQAGSVRALRQYGAGTLAATLDIKLPPIEPAFAHRGDVVMADDGQGGAALGISFGHFMIGVGAEGEREGLVRIDRRLWQRAWRVA